MGLMSSIVSIGTVILQSAINKLGMTIISAQISARRIMSFALLPMAAISTSMTTFTSQNFGAKRFRRIQKASNKLVFSPSFGRSLLPSSSSLQAPS